MNNTASTRRVMVGAFVGALIVLVASTTLGWHVGPDVAGEADGPTNAVRDAPPGTCLTWKRPDASDARQVKCEDPHLFELTGSVDISADFRRVRRSRTRSAGRASPRTAAPRCPPPTWTAGSTPTASSG